MFKNGGKKFKYIPTKLLFRKEKNRAKTVEEKKAKVTGLLEKEKEKRIRMKELGINYEFAGYKGLIEAYKKAMNKA